MLVSFVSLGCPKNQVNCEQMIWQTHAAGHEVSLTPEDSDVVVLNTCGFLQEAKAEALAHYATLAKLKQDGKVQKILLAGCMAQRYRDDLPTLCPEADGYLGVCGYEDIAKLLSDMEAGEFPARFDDINTPVPETDRVVISSDHWAYLRIAEGCDNRCHFCMIPSIRGKFRSRPMEKILEEAQSLADCGIKEIMLVAQDTSRYGLDLYGTPQLTALLHGLCQIEGIRWIRVHYLYPDEIDDALIDCIAGEEKIVKYLDMPLQHSSDKMLALMNRRGDAAYIRALITRLRERIPGLVLRTSLICGHPGEGEAEFEDLAEFMREYRIERAGIFAFSPEEGSVSYHMADQVPPEETQRRLALLTQIQLEVMDDFAAGQLGRSLTILCDGYAPEMDSYVGRSAYESPDIDGMLYLDADFEPQIGTYYQAEISKLEDGELYATLIREVY